VVAPPPEWWQIIAALSPLAVLLAAVIAAVIGVLTIRQRARADNRAEWWRRAQWALDASLSKEPSQAEMGQKAIELLSKSKLATPEDGTLLKIGTTDALDAAFLAHAAERRVSEVIEVAGTPEEPPQRMRVLLDDTVLGDQPAVDEADASGDNGYDNDDDTDR
jgi:hypothetical protein